MADTNGIDRQAPEFALALVGHFIREGIEMRKPGANCFFTEIPGAHDLATETETKIMAEATGDRQATRFSSDGGGDTSLVFHFVYTTVQYDMNFKSDNSISIKKISPATAKNPNEKFWGKK